MTPLTVKLPDWVDIKLTAMCTLALPDLTVKVREVHIILGISYRSLLSVVNLCSAGCGVNFTKIGCYVKYRDKIVMKGDKCTKTGLYMVPLSEPIVQSTLPPAEQKCTTDECAT